MLYKIPSSIAVCCVTVTTSRGRLLKVSGVFHIPKGSSMTVSRNRILSLGLGQKCRTTRRQCVTPLAKVSRVWRQLLFCLSKINEATMWLVSMYEKTCMSHVRKDLPWDMLYADDLNIATETLTDAQTRLTKWHQALEHAGLRVNASKTKTMVCAKIQEKVDIVDCHGKRLNQVNCFKYLGSTITATGGCETDVKCMCKWKELSGVVCDKR